MEAPKWEEAYATHTLKIASGMEIICAWRTTREEKAYGVSFCGRVLIKRFDNLDEAKAAGIRLAERVLESARAALLAARTTQEKP